MKTSQPMLDAALGYVRRGWEVFPVPRGTKCGYSIKKRGFDNGKPWGKTKDEGEAREYWRKLPRANIGVPMGIGSGIFDVECDTKAGHSNLKQDGAASLAELEAQHGALPATLMFVSPSGSVHRLYKHPGGNFKVEHSVSKLGEGIDVIGDGFMSVVPPSIKPGKGQYEWLNNLPIAAAAQWLINFVCEKNRRSAQNIWQQFGQANNISIAKLTAALAVLPNNDLAWPDWNRIAMAIWRATDGSVEGYQLFAAWSAKSKKCGVEEQPADTWERLDGCRPTMIRGPTILYLAEQAVPDWEQRLDERDPEIKALCEEFFELMDAVAA
jgi:hypothetical protein